MNHLRLASAMGALAYVFVLPILVIALLPGLALTAEGSRLWPTIPDGSLLFYTFGRNMPESGRKDRHEGKNYGA
jgi:hypothetical protein